MFYFFFTIYAIVSYELRIKSEILYEYYRECESIDYHFIVRTLTNGTSAPSGGKSLAYSNGGGGGGVFSFSGSAGTTGTSAAASASAAATGTIG